MKQYPNIKRLTLLSSLLACACMFQTHAANLPVGFPDTDRTKLNINPDWKFHLGDADADLFVVDLDDSGWQTVSVPHTLKLTSLILDGLDDDKTQPTFHREVGWYRRDVEVGENPEKLVFLEFEGAHQVTDLWVNGKHVGQHSIGGYSPFHFEISKYVEFGKKNQITLRVDNRRRADIPPDPGPFDYVKFSGLYRDVYLVETNKLHIPFRWEDRQAGVRFTTPSVDYLNYNATVNVSTGVMNSGDEPRECTVVNRVIDEQGVVVLKLSTEVCIAAGEMEVVNQIGGIEKDLHLWELDRPYLYRLNTVIIENNKEVDFAEEKVGFRKFELDPEKGFRLNGKIIELVGMNRHQHYGYVGDAMPDSLHRKDIFQLKELGMNIVRTAHYPQDDALLDACDEVGMLVYEEAPTWIDMSVNKGWFDNLEESARVMVRNHYNHPSLVMWGAGINHRGPVASVHYAVKQEDPFRLTVSQSSRWTGWQTSGMTDVFGNMNYGPVVWDRQEQLLAMEGRRGPKTVAEYKRDPMMPGIISWVAHAYYTFHPSHTWIKGVDRTRGGLMTVFREPKDQDYHWYESEAFETPMIHMVEDWSEGQSTYTIFSNCDSIDIAINGKPIRTIYPTNDPVYRGLDHPPYVVSGLPYEKGEIKFIGKIEDKVVVNRSYFTPGEAVALRLEFDMKDRVWTADGSDFAVGHAFVVDENDQVLRDFQGKVSFKVKGEGVIIGDDVEIMANPAFVIRGMAAVLIRSTRTAGKATVTAMADGLKPSSAKLKSVPYYDDMIASNAAPIYDLETVRVDMGASDQLVQFSWTPWYGEDLQESTLTLEKWGGVNVSIQPNSESGILRWLGEMNVIGLDGYVYGEGVLGVDPEGIVLEFSGLPRGKYSLKSYHHAPRSLTDSMDPNLDKLKTLKVLDIPYAKVLKVGTVDDLTQVAVTVTEGSNLQYSRAAIAETLFESDGKSSVRVLIKDPKGEKGVWLNGFELSEHPSF